MNKSEDVDGFVKWFDAFSPEFIAEKNKEEHEKTVRQYEEFSEKYDNGICYLCNSSFKTFSSQKTCLHYLLKPKGFKKKHFRAIYEKYSFHQIQSYLRWLANKERPIGNINNLTEEMSENKLYEITIKYKRFEWSFSCSNSDFIGHGNSTESQKPHYHFQMRNDGLPFIDYSDFHIPFSDEDKFIINMKLKHPDKIKHTFPFGEGIEEALSEDIIEEVIDNSTSTDSEEKGTFRFQTLVEAKPGETISGDVIANMIEESKKTGKPLASLVKKLDAKITTIVSPSNSVPELAKRTQRKRK